MAPPASSQPVAVQCATAADDDGEESRVSSDERLPTQEKSSGDDSDTMEREELSFHPGHSNVVMTEVYRFSVL